VKKILGIFSIIFVVSFLFVLPFLIKVKVNCKSQYGTCPQQISDKLTPINGKSLFYAKKTIKNIFKTEFIISDYSLQYKIPDILNIDLLVKKPVITFKYLKSASILVDAEGKVLSGATESALPVINIDKELPKEGQNIEGPELFALNLAVGVYQMYQVREFLLQENSLLVELPGQFKVIFPLDGDSRILLGSLRLIYSKVRSEGNPAGVSQVDLRFTNPVLR
jgi:hypothetical protein